MKNIIKIITILMLIFTFSCENNNDGNFKSDPTTGWVEFVGAATTISVITTELELPLSLNVPIYENGLTVSYTLEAVQGDFNSIVVSTGSSVFFNPSDYSRSGSIVLNFSNISLANQIIFDVVLTAVDASGVTVGVDNASVVRHRVSTPCPLDIQSWVGTYSVQEMFTDGPNAPLGLGDFFGESYQLDISLDPSDVTQTKVIINNSSGFDTYINNGTVMSFDTCNSTVSFDAGFPEVALFRVFEFETSSYDEGTFTIICSGPLATFGPYEFVLTKL